MIIIIICSLLKMFCMKINIIYLWNKGLEGGGVKFKGEGRRDHVWSDVVLQCACHGVDEAGRFGDVIGEPEIDHLGGVGDGRERGWGEGGLHRMGNGIELSLMGHGE